MDNSNQTDLEQQARADAFAKLGEDERNSVPVSFRITLGDYRNKDGLQLGITQNFTPQVLKMQENFDDMLEIVSNSLKGAAARILVAYLTDQAESEDQVKWYDEEAREELFQKFKAKESV